MDRVRSFRGPAHKTLSMILGIPSDSSHFASVRWCLPERSPQFGHSSCQTGWGQSYPPERCQHNPILESIIQTPSNRKYSPGRVQPVIGGPNPNQNQANESSTTLSIVRSEPKHNNTNLPQFEEPKSLSSDPFEFKRITAKLLYASLLESSYLTLAPIKTIEPFVCSATP